MSIWVLGDRRRTATTRSFEIGGDDSAARRSSEVNDGPLSDGLGAEEQPRVAAAAAAGVGCEPTSPFVSVIGGASPLLLHTAAETVFWTPSFAPSTVLEWVCEALAGVLPEGSHLGSTTAASSLVRSVVGASAPTEAPSSDTPTAQGSVLDLRHGSDGCWSAMNPDQTLPFSAPLGPAKPARLANVPELAVVPPEAPPPPPANGPRLFSVTGVELPAAAQLAEPSSLAASSATGSTTTGATAWLLPRVWKAAKRKAEAAVEARAEFQRWAVVEATTRKTLMQRAAARYAHDRARELMTRMTASPGVTTAVTGSGAPGFVEPATPNVRSGASTPGVAAGGSEGARSRSRSRSPMMFGVASIRDASKGSASHPPIAMSVVPTGASTSWTSLPELPSATNSVGGQNAAAGTSLASLAARGIGGATFAAAGGGVPRKSQALDAASFEFSVNATLGQMALFGSLDDPLTLSAKANTSGRASLVLGGGSLRAVLTPSQLSAHSRDSSARSSDSSRPLNAAALPPGLSYVAHCALHGIAPIRAVHAIFDACRRRAVRPSIAAASPTTDGFLVDVKGPSDSPEAGGNAEAPLPPYDLPSLDLSPVCCGPRGVLPILQTLPLVGAFLTKLSLRGCGINGAAVELLAVMAGNALPRLASLDLRDNPFVGFQAGCALQRYAVSASCLEWVLLEGTSVRPATARSINAHLAARRAKRAPALLPSWTTLPLAPMVIDDMSSMLDAGLSILSPTSPADSIVGFPNA